MSNRRRRGEGTIYQRKDGRWEASARLGNGKRKSFYGKTPQEVEQKISEAVVGHRHGAPMPDGVLKLSAFLDEWLSIVEHRVKPGTLRAYKLNVHRATELIGGVRLSELGAAHLDRAYADLLKTGLSKRTVHHVHTVLHGALSLAVKQRRLAFNPADAASPPRPEHREMQTLTPAGARLLLAKAEYRYHALFAVLLTGGLRIGEALALSWDDLDTETGELAIRRSLQRVKGKAAEGEKAKGELVFLTPKTRGSRRTICLPDLALQALAVHRKKQLEERVAAGELYHDEGLIFARADGGRMESAVVWRAFSKTLEEAELPHVRLHDLRHTFATLQLRAGTSYRAVQSAMGHSTPSQTIGTYQHIDVGLAREAAAAIGRVLEAPAENGRQNGRQTAGAGSLTQAGK